MRLKTALLNILITPVLAISGVAIIGVMTASIPTYAAPSHHATPHPHATPQPSQPSSQPSASSACPDSATSKGQVLQGLGVTGSDCSDSQVNKTIQTIVTILSLVIGIASVIVIMVSGFKYIVSGGEQGKVANAKSSLIYALVGLAVAATAQLMIHFVLHNTNAT